MKRRVTVPTPSVIIFLQQRVLKCFTVSYHLTNPQSLLALLKNDGRRKYYRTPAKRHSRYKQTVVPPPPEFPCPHSLPRTRKDQRLSRLGYRSAAALTPETPSVNGSLQNVVRRTSRPGLTVTIETTTRTVNIKLAVLTNQTPGSASSVA